MTHDDYPEDPNEDLIIGGIAMVITVIIIAILVKAAS